MTADLQKAIAHMEAQGSTCVLCRGESLFSSHTRGIRPLLEFLDSGINFSGFCAADKVVGKATAFLYCLLGVREVYAQVLSDAAAEVFNREGISFSCRLRVSTIRNRQGTGPCPMEQATEDLSDPLSAVAAIRAALALMQK